MKPAFLLLLVVLFGGCATGVLIGAGEAPPPSTHSPSDQRLAAAVTRALVQARDVPAMDIRVSAAAGVVTLSGQVPARTAIGRAIAVARGVPGVREVRSTLDVRR